MLFFKYYLFIYYNNNLVIVNISKLCLSAQQTFGTIYKIV